MAAVAYYAVPAGRRASCLLEARSREPCDSHLAGLPGLAILFGQRTTRATTQSPEQSVVASSGIILRRSRLRSEPHNSKPSVRRSQARNVLSAAGDAPGCVILAARDLRLPICSKVAFRAGQN